MITTIVIALFIWYVAIPAVHAIILSIRCVRLSRKLQKEYDNDQAT